MSSTILTNWTIYYADDAAAGAGMKQIRWTGGSSGTNTVNELYSAVMNLFDDAAQNEAHDTIPIKAITPTLYEIGSSDARDLQPWFIDPESVKHLTGAGLNTAKWARTGGGTGDAGIIKITRSGTNIVTGDIGATIANGTATGWLLYVSGTNLWVRPTSNAVAHNWSASSGNIVCNGHTDTQASGTSSAESIWTNIYTIGTIAANTQIYLYQNGAQVTPWWTTDHIDILIQVRDTGVLIDSGNVTILARQYTKLYDHYVADLSRGNQVPIPLATFPDSNNVSGYRTFTGSSGTGTFTVGSIIQKSGDPTVQGIITSVNGASATPTIEYYLFAYPFTDFTLLDDIIQIPAGPACTAGTPASAGPAALAGVSITFGTISRDLNNGRGFVNYDVEIDCNNQPLLSIYEYCKYVTRYGNTSLLNGITGESYIRANSSYDPVKQSPFGTFAGGQFFGGRGVWLKNVPASDASNYVLIDATNTQQSPPLYVSLAVTNIAAGDRVGVFRTTGNNNVIDKSEFTIQQAHTTGVAYIRVASPITNDHPSQGSIRVVRRSVTGRIIDEQRYIYSSFNNTNQPTYSTFVLTSTTTIDYGTNDTAYVPFIDQESSSTSVSVAIAYITNQYVTTRVRKRGFLPYLINGEITSSGLTVTAIKNIDTIID